MYKALTTRYAASVRARLESLAREQTEAETRPTGGDTVAADVESLLDPQTGSLRIIPANWDAWFESRPESPNVIDLRSPQDIAIDNRIRPKLPPLVQFPAYEEPKKRGPR